MKLDLKSKGTITSLAVSPDGKWLAVGQIGYDEVCLTICDTATWKSVAEVISNNVFSVSFNRHSDTLAYATGDNTVGIFDLKTMQVKRTIEMLKPVRVVYARSKDLLLIMAEVVKVLDANNEVLFTYDDYKAYQETDGLDPALFKDYYTLPGWITDGAQYRNFPAAAVFCHQDNNIIITGNNDNKFSVYNLQSGQLTAQFFGGALQAGYMLSDKAEKYLYLISQVPDTELLWNLETMERLLPEVMTGQLYGPSFACFHPTSHFIASSGKSGYISFRDIKTGKFLYQEYIHKKEVNALTFSVDGNLLISGDTTGKVLITNITEFIK
jgi:WD40 repeat protein